MTYEDSWPMDKANDANWHDARWLHYDMVYAKYGASGFPVGGPDVSVHEAARRAELHRVTGERIRKLAKPEDI